MGLFFSVGIAEERNQFVEQAISDEDFKLSALHPENRRNSQQIFLGASLARYPNDCFHAE